MMEKKEDEFQKKEIAKLLPWKAVVMQNDWTAAVMVAIDEAKKNFSGNPEIITPGENRIVRSRLALEFASLAHRFYDALSGDDKTVMSPDMPIDGISVEVWWKNALSILDEAVSSFEKSDRKSGIGKAKAKELRDLCNYYCETLGMLKLKRYEIKSSFGRLIIAILECESFWNTYIDKTRKKPQTSNPDAKMIASVIKRLCEQLKISEICSLKNILSDYLSCNDDTDNLDQLLDCIRCCMNNPKMLRSLGATSDDERLIKKLLKIDTERWNHVK